MTGREDRWLITDAKDSDAQDYTWVTNTARSAALLLQHAVHLTETRRRLVAEAGQREWTGPGLEIVIDANRRILADTESRNAVAHLVRHGRLAGVHVTDEEAGR